MAGRHQRYRLSCGPRGRRGCLGRLAPAGVYFQLTLGGITGHNDFPRFTGVLLKPGDCVKVAGAIVRVFLRNGDRTNRNKARLQYVLDDWGFERYLEEVEQELGESLRRAPLEVCEPNASDNRQAHVDAHGQLQPGLNYIGVVVPVGRINSEQMRGTLSHCRYLTATARSA